MTGFEIGQGSFAWDIQHKFSPVRAERPWNGFPRETVDSSSLEVPKAGWDGARSALGWGEEAAGWNGMGWKVPPTQPIPRSQEREDGGEIPGIREQRAGADPAGAAGFGWLGKGGAGTGREGMDLRGAIPDIPEPARNKNPLVGHPCPRQQEFSSPSPP